MLYLLILLKVFNNIMEIQIISVGKRMPKWINDAFDEYLIRIKKEIKINLTEIPTQIRAKTSDINKIKELEANKILKEIKPGLIISLDEQGKSFSTLDLAKKLNSWKMEYQNVNLIIGGPDGIAKEILDKSHEVLSLSQLTFPHALVRIILIEQLYRAQSIINKHPYHRS